MTLRRIPNEQPPPFDDPRQVEWLTRIVLLINGALTDTVDFTPVPDLPPYITNGTARYFNRAIPLTDITSPGPWMYVEGVWQKLTV